MSKRSASNICLAAWKLKMRIEHVNAEIVRLLQFAICNWCEARVQLGGSFGVELRWTVSQRRPTIVGRPPRRTPEIQLLTKGPLDEAAVLNFLDDRAPLLHDSTTPSFPGFAQLRA